jgi:SAM-dependent methyltransferase
MDLREVPAELALRHPWEIARARFFGGLLDQYGVLTGPRAVLDVGAGDTFLATQLSSLLAPGSRVVCFDEHYSDRHLAELEIRTPAIASTRVRPADKFDLVLLLDVIEHVPDDREFLGGFVRQNLAPGGKVLISVPAWQALFTMHDVMLGHYRRYRPSQLLDVIERTGLALIASGGLFHSLLVPRTIAKLSEVLRRVSHPEPGVNAHAEADTEAGRWTAGSTVTNLVLAALAADNACSRAAAKLRIELPGLSTWALAEKR